MPSLRAVPATTSSTARTGPPEGMSRSESGLVFSAMRKMPTGGIFILEYVIGKHVYIDIDKVSDEEIQDIVMTANLTPRKCLGFKTPLQAILKELGKDVQIRFA